MDMFDDDVYFVPMTEDEINLVLKSLHWTVTTLFEKKGNDFPISLREARELGYRLETMLIEYKESVS